MYAGGPGVPCGNPKRPRRCGTPECICLLHVRRHRLRPAVWRRLLPGSWPARALRCLCRPFRPFDGLVPLRCPISRRNGWPWAAGIWPEATQRRPPGPFTEWMGCNWEIAPADDIYRFFENHPASVNPLRDYLADGWSTLSELILLLEQVDRPLLKVGHCLEFASGHGRFTRHLVKALGAQRVTVSDVVADAVSFTG